MLIALISMVLVGSRGRVPGVTPISIGCAKRPPGSATELCGRDFLSLVLNVSNSNELQGIDHSQP